jgi:hypothetical protein
MNKMMRRLVYLVHLSVYVGAVEKKKKKKKKRKKGGSKSILCSE